MKKNNISLILSALIFLLPQMNSCSQSQGWYSYVPSASSALQSFKDYGSAFVQGAAGRAGRAFGSVAGSIKSLSTEAQVALFFAVAGALAVAGYQIYYSLPNGKEIKQITPETPKNVNIEDETTAKSTEKKSIKADSSLLKPQQPAEFVDVEKSQQIEQPQSMVVTSEEKISESSSRKEQIETPAQQELQIQLEQEHPEAFEHSEEESPVYKTVQSTKESYEGLKQIQPPHVTPSSTITTTTTVAPTIVKKSQEPVSISIKLRNATTHNLFKYTTDDDCGKPGAGSKLEKTKKVDNFITAELYYDENEKITNIILKNAMKDSNQIESFCIKMDNDLSKTISHNEILYFKAILRNNFPTIEKTKNIKDVELAVGLGGTSGWMKSQIITVDLNVLPNNKYTPSNQTDAPQIKFLREKLLDDQKLFPLVLHNEYDDVIYTKESINTLIDAANCDDNASKIIKKNETHHTFGTVLLKYDETNNIKDIIFQRYTENKPIETFCVKSCTKGASYQTLYGRLSTLRDNMLKNKNNIATKINAQSFFQLNLRPPNQTQNSWMPIPLTSYEVNLELRNTLSNKADLTID